MLGTLFETPEDRAVEHAYSVLRGDFPGSVQPNSQQRELLRILADRRGAGRAIQIHRLAEMLKTTPRELKSDVRDLRILFRVRIGSSRDQHAGGYYLITSTKELMATVSPMLNQLRSEAEVIRAMCYPHELAEMEGQLRLTETPTPTQEKPHAA